MKKRLTALAMCVVLLSALLPLQSGAQATDGTDRRIIVSLGDSYSSGEGIPPFYGQDKGDEEKLTEDDWVAHRSTKAWSGLLTLPGVNGNMNQHRGENWYFAASSGAETKHIAFTGEWNEKDSCCEGEQIKDFDKGNHQGFVKLPGQLDILNTEGLDPNDVDYVTLTIGGNDLGFVPVLEKAHYLFSSEVYDYLVERLEHFNDEHGVRDSIKAAYERVSKAMPNAKIIVAGYPELLEENMIDGLGIVSAESKAINSAVRIFNQLLEQLVQECHDDGMPIYFVSVEEAFRGHAAYSEDPYINPIYYGPKLMDEDLTDFGVTSAYSMHPNAKGAAAYAACVQAKIDELEGIEREVVLVLDTSSSMSGEPIDQTKIAAHKFIETVLPEDTSVGLVRYSSSAERLASCVTDRDYLDYYVDDVLTGGGTNLEAGLREASLMLAPDRTTERPATPVKQTRIIVLMTDGEANEGKTGDDLIAYADELKQQGYLLYTLGFFQDLTDKSEPQRVLEAMASNGHHYEVENAEDLRFFFEDMADDINGTPFVYVRIECPVDVSVTFDGETLSSAEDNTNTRTSFGTLSFEENPESGDRTKILRLREDVTNYDIRITGTGEGTMNYKIGYVDENGDYSDMREIADVPITQETVIETGVNRIVKTDLAVDNDGDGKVDKHYTASGPSVVDLTEEEHERGFPVFWVALGAALIVALTVLGIVLTRKARRRRAETEHRFCGSCGAVIPADADFCPECGRRVQ